MMKQVRLRGRLAASSACFATVEGHLNDTLAIRERIAQDSPGAARKARDTFDKVFASAKRVLEKAKREVASLRSGPLIEGAVASVEAHAGALKRSVVECQDAVQKFAADCDETLKVAARIKDRLRSSAAVVADAKAKLGALEAERQDAAHAAAMAVIDSNLRGSVVLAKRCISIENNVSEMLSPGVFGGDESTIRKVSSLAGEYSDAAEEYAKQIVSLLRAYSTAKHAAQGMLARIEQLAAALDVVRADARAKGVIDVQDVAEALEACQRELSKGTEIMSEKLLESAESHLEKARQSISGALLEIERKREVLRLAMQKLAGAETRMRNAMVDATESGIDTLEVIRAAIREANKAVEGGKIKMPTSPENAGHMRLIAQDEDLETVIGAVLSKVGALEEVVSEQKVAFEALKRAKASSEHDIEALHARLRRIVSQVVALGLSDMSTVRMATRKAEAAVDVARGALRSNDRPTRIDLASVERIAPLLLSAEELVEEAEQTVQSEAAAKSEEDRILPGLISRLETAVDELGSMDARVEVASIRRFARVAEVLAIASKAVEKANGLVDRRQTSRLRLGADKDALEECVDAVAEAERSISEAHDAISAQMEIKERVDATLRSVRASLDDVKSKVHSIQTLSVVMEIEGEEAVVKALRGAEKAARECQQLFEATVRKTDDSSIDGDQFDSEVHELEIRVQKASDLVHEAEVALHREKKRVDEMKRLSIEREKIRIQKEEQAAKEAKEEQKRRMKIKESLRKELEPAIFSLGALRAVVEVEGLCAQSSTVDKCIAGALSAVNNAEQLLLDDSAVDSVRGAVTAALSCVVEAERTTRHARERLAEKIKASCDAG